MKRFTILVIPGYKLFPLDTGGAHHQLVFLNRQQYQHSIDLVVIPENIQPENLDAFKKQFPAINLIPVGYNRSSLFSRWGSFFQKQFRKIRRQGFPYRLKKIKELRNLVLRDHALLRAVTELVRNNNYDIIQIEHSVNIGLIEILPPKPVKIFVHHEIAHTRIESDLLAKNYKPAEANHFSLMAEKLETTWLKDYDGLITLSDDDKILLQQKGISKPIQVAAPFSYFEEELNNIFDPVLSPHLIFAGNETHFPNKEGLGWFLKEVYPLLGKKPGDLKLLITGNWSEEFKKGFSFHPGIRFTGIVSDLKTVFRNGIMIIPIRIGSGIRVKALSALCYGMPVISTSFAVKGIPGLIDRKNVILADEAGAFANAILELLDNRDLRKKLSEQGFELAKTEFDKGLFVKERNMFYEQVVAQKNQV